VGNWEELKESRERRGKRNAIAECDGRFSWLLDLVALIYIDDSAH
jgi:hypothetical protein